MPAGPAGRLAGRGRGRRHPQGPAYNGGGRRAPRAAITARAAAAPRQRASERASARLLRSAAGAAAAPTSPAAAGIARSRVIAPDIASVRGRHAAVMHTGTRGGVCGIENSSACALAAEAGGGGISRPTLELRACWARGGGGLDDTNPGGGVGQDEGNVTLPLSPQWVPPAPGSGHRRADGRSAVSELPGPNNRATENTLGCSPCACSTSVAFRNHQSYLLFKDLVFWGLGWFSCFDFYCC